MTADDKHDLHALAKQSILRHFDEDELNLLLQRARREVYEAGNVIAEEGDPGERIYFITDGKVEIVKRAKGHGDGEHQIATIGSGSCVGEMSLVDAKPRSATIRAMRRTEMISVAIDDVQREPALRQKILANLSPVLSERLRYTNDVTVAALSEELDHLREKHSMGAFLLVTICATSIYSLMLVGVETFARFLPSRGFLTATVITALAAGCYYYVKRSHFPNTVFGLTRENWRASVRESLRYTLFFLLGLVVVKWLIIILGDLREPLFRPGDAFETHRVSMATWLFAVALYALLAPVQEFIARGLLQSSIFYFFPDSGSLRADNPLARSDSAPQSSVLVQKATWFGIKHYRARTARTWKAIVISNLLFCAMHGHLGIGFAIAVFIPGLFWGWLYSRHKTLVGVAVSHMIIGVFSVYVLGISSLLRLGA